jgi:hypothetical protein
MTRGPTKLRQVDTNFRKYAKRRVTDCWSIGIAAGLDERGIPAARGGKWSSVQVMRLLEAAQAQSPSKAEEVTPVSRLALSWRAVSRQCGQLAAGWFQSNTR